MRRIRFYFGLFFWFCSLWCYAVERELYFNNISLEHGLNQGAIYSIAHDPYGFTWVGTQDGLHRFDGNTVELVKLSPTSLPKYRYIRDIKVINNQLYIATTEGLVVINLLTGEKHYPEVHDAAIYSVIQVNQQIWLGSDIGLIILNSANKITHYYGNNKLLNNRYSFCGLPSSPKLCSSEVRTLVHDKTRQTVWLGTNTGLLSYNLKGEKEQDVNNFTYHNILSPHAASNTIRKLFISSKGVLWIGSYHGLHYVDLNSANITTSIKSIYHQKNTPDSLANNRVLAIAEDKVGGMWFGTTQGLSFYSAKALTAQANFSQGWQNFHAQNASTHSLLDNLVRSLLIDGQGRIWVGTNKGISVTNEQRLQLATYRAKTSDSFNNYILSISEESKDKYWLGTRNGLYAFTQNKANSLPLLEDEVVYDTLIHSHYLWAATRNGLFKIDLTQQRVIAHYHASNSPVGDTFIYKLILHDNNLWLGTTSGLHQFNLASSQWQSWYKKDGLIDSQIYALHQFDNKLWVGTRKGLSIFDLASSKITNYSAKNSALLSPWIFNITQMDKDNYLIASDGGIYQFMASTSAFEYIGITQGNAYGALEGESGVFWITSNNGLYRYDSATKNYTKYIEKHGFASNEYNLNASLRDTQGQLLFGTINGFVIFNPSKLNDIKQQIKPRLISSIQVEGKRYSLWDAPRFTDEKAVFLAKKLNLGWKNEALELQLSNPYFALEAPISEESFPAAINLTNTQSGAYFIDLSSAAENNIQLIKPLHPLLRWWAILLYVALFSLILVFLVRYRLMMKFNADILKNNQVIARQKNEIEQHLLFKQNLYLQIQHSFKSPVFACRGLSEQIRNGLKSDVELDKLSIERKNNKLLAGLEQVSSLIDEFIILTKQQPKQNNLVKQNVIEVFNQVDALMSQVASSSKVLLEFSYDESVTVLDHILASDKSLYLIIENLLSNAIKFSKPLGMVKVSATKQSAYLIIEIKDNGCGFSQQDLSNIFTLYYRGKQDKSYSGTGVGLTTAKSLIDELGGEIYFNKNKPCGTKVTVKLPLEEKDGSG